MTVIPQEKLANAVNGFVVLELLFFKLVPEIWIARMYWYINIYIHLHTIHKLFISYDKIDNFCKLGENNTT